MSPVVTNSLKAKADIEEEERRRFLHRQQNPLRGSLSPFVMLWTGEG